MKTVLEALQTVLKGPFLTQARELHRVLSSTQGIQEHLFGRDNQKAAVESNSTPFYSQRERMTNAIDGTLKAAAQKIGFEPQSSEEAIQLFNQTSPRPGWEPDARLADDHFTPPLLRIWEEELHGNQSSVVNPFAKKIVTALLRDSGGMVEDTFRNGFLEINSSMKLRDKAALGAYGWGGFSSLYFSEYVLVLTRSRQNPDEVLWTLIFVKEDGESKQEFLRYWFSDEQGRPLRFNASELNINDRDDAEICRSPFGTQVFHIGYNGDGWTTDAAQRKTSPVVLFKEAYASFPLDFYIQQEHQPGKDRRLKRPGNSLLHRLQAEQRCKPVTVPFRLR